MPGTVTDKKWKAWDKVRTTTLECKKFHESVQWQLTTHFCCRSLKTELTKDWFLHTNVSCTYRQSTDYTSHTVAAAVSITRQISALNAVSYTSANGGCRVAASVPGSVYRPDLERKGNCRHGPAGHDRRIFRLVREQVPNRFADL